MQRRHSFTLPTLIALAFPAMLTNCVAEPATDPGEGGTGAVGGSGVAGTATVPGFSENKVKDTTVDCIIHIQPFE